MHKIPINPFQDTKASFFDIDKIIDNWVDLGGNKFIDSVMIPNSSTPIRIFGGKGTGKTHILRFFSYQSQQLRASKNNRTILEQIQSDGYIGIYIEASGLEVNRFSGCGYSEDEWRKTFYYFFNLELIERVLKKLNKIFDSDKKINFEDVSISFFDEDSILSLSTIDELYKYIRKERKNIDNQISDLSTPGNRESLNIKPLFKLENGFQDIVKAILDSIEEINNVRILYIIDEIENFSIEHQKYINSLVRHIGGVHNISLRLAGRLYGKKTDDTYDSDQKLLEGAEIKTIFLEDILEPNFKEFAQALYQKRIEVAYGNEIKVDFQSVLEKRKECDDTQLSEIMEKHKGKDRKHLKRLKSHLTTYKEYRPKEIDLILSNILCESDWFIEKINIYLLYQDWDSDLLRRSKEVKLSCKKYIEGRKPNLHDNAISKHGLDMRYQLYRDYGRSISYAGYDEIIKMSNSNPRIFLSIFDNLYKTCSFSKIDLLFTSDVSCSIQDRALLESSSWFWSNFTTEVKDAKVLRAFIALCEFFRSYRRSDKPGEKYAVIFSYDESLLTEDIKKLIDMAIDNSLLIKLQDRKDRNTGKFLKNLRIHPMLSPKWELPVGAGGTVTLKKETLQKLFLNRKDSKMDECFKEILQLVDVPFQKKKPEKIIEQTNQEIEKSKQKSLFEGLNDN